MLLRVNVGSGWWIIQNDRETLNRVKYIPKQEVLKIRKVEDKLKKKRAHRLSPFIFILILEIQLDSFDYVWLKNPVRVVWFLI